MGQIQEVYYIISDFLLILLAIFGYLAMDFTTFIFGLVTCLQTLFKKIVKLFEEKCFVALNEEFFTVFVVLKRKALVKCVIILLLFHCFSTFVYS